MRAPSELLFVTPVTPSTYGNGLAMRAGLFLEGLARCGPVRVLVAPVFGGTPRPSALVLSHAAEFSALPLDHSLHPGHRLIETLSLPSARHRARALHPLPLLCRTATPAMAEVVAEAAAGCHAVHVMRLYLAPFLDALLGSSGRPRLVLDLDDIDSAVQRSLGHTEEANGYERLESHYLPQLDHLITCSAADARLVANRYGATTVTPVSNAVRIPRALSAPAAHQDLVFVGNLSYRPNVDAACWLCHEVLARMDGTTLAIVGSRPGPTVRALSSERVTIAGDVPDVSPWYAGARVAVAPLQAGGGTRIKVLEALAHRRPVVATTRGAEGLDIAENGTVVIADSPIDFAAACRRLLDDPDEAAWLASRGEAMVRESATVEVVAAFIERLFRNILAAA
jgi:glycosyltransferase involved in cell wall biosynthesis